MKLQHRGFTLIELIVVLVLIGVLAVSVVPRFFDASGTSEYLYRDQALNILRRVQIQAMQCTASTCTQPELQLMSDRMGISSTCQNNATHLCIASRDNISMQTQPVGLFPLSFSALGVPLNGGGGRQCGTGNECRISFEGAITLSICIEEEGYIHPC